jgi:hypothetical protein
LKYAVKPACIDDFTPTHLRDFIAMKNQRLFGTFGEFLKFARDYEPDSETLDTLFPPTARNVGAPCSTCGDPLRDVRVNASELADFLERLDISQSLE